MRRPGVACRACVGEAAVFCQTSSLESTPERHPPLPHRVDIVRSMVPSLTKSSFPSPSLSRPLYAVVVTLPMLTAARVNQCANSSCEHIDMPLSVRLWDGAAGAGPTHEIQHSVVVAVQQSEDLCSLDLLLPLGQLRVVAENHPSLRANSPPRVSPTVNAPLMSGKN